MKKRVIHSDALKSLYPPMDEAFERRMLRTIQDLPEKKEERIVKRKLSVGLAIALALLIATTATALALTLSKAFFEDAAKLQLESGYYDAWSLKEKLGFLKIMQENGILPGDARVDEILNGKMDDAAREKALDDLMAERYGGPTKRTENIGVESILYVEMGPMDGWSLEDKAWYTRMLMDLGLLGFDTEVFLLPGKDVISPEEAVEAVYAELKDVYGLTAQELNAYQPMIEYGLHRSEYELMEPYYTVHFALKDADGTVDYENPRYAYDYTCNVAGDGRILCAADGYVGVESPRDALERERRTQEEERLTVEERLNRHRDTAQAVPAACYELSEGNTLESALALRDGTVLVYGAAVQANGVLAGLEIGEYTPYAVCLNEAGETVWRRTLAKGVSVECAMQLKDGDILLYVAENPFSCGPYTQVRLSERGEMLEEIALPGTEALVGVRLSEADQNFASVGHGGFLLTGSIGQTHTLMFAQLNARGEVVWARLYDELTGRAARIQPTADGYLVIGQIGSLEHGLPLLCRLDREGNPVGSNEGEADEGLRGVRILRALELEDGGLIAFGEAGGIGGMPVFLRLDEKGKAVWVKTREETVKCLAGSQIVQTEKGFIFALEHGVSEYGEGRHLALLEAGEDGSLRELYPEDADEISAMGGGPHLLPIGNDGKLAIVCWGYVKENGEEKRVSRMIVF